MRLGVSTDFGAGNCSDFIKANTEVGIWRNAIDSDANDNRTSSQQ